MLSKYCSHVDDELSSIEAHLTDNEYLKAHVAFLERRYKRFTTAFRVRSFIIKFIPIVVLVLIMLFPTKQVYVWYMPAALLIVVASEVIIGRLYPVAYFNKIHGNITILKSIIQHNIESKLKNSTNVLYTN